jgi:UDP-N-acetylmuramoylalanine--D-glutamate ligase
LLLGLGRANLGVAQYLLKRGDEVHLYEDNIARLSAPGRKLVEQDAIAPYNENVRYDAVITSPGFPMDKQIIRKLIQKSLPVIDEIEFTYTELKQPKIIAVTGTNGKSTTAALVSEILSAAGINNFLGGNISPGTPFSQALFMPPYEYYVLEISSFQLMRVKNFKPFIGILTNISIDHMNWHKSFEEYKNAKLRLFMNQKHGDYAVLNYTDEQVRLAAKNIDSSIVYFGSGVKDGVWVDGHYCYKKERVVPLGVSRLEGVHNRMNIMAAIAVAKILEVQNKTIEQALRRFKTLPHRLEDVGTYHGVRYINNSMCTNETAAIESFHAVSGDKIVIVGGKPKGDTGDAYLDVLTKSAKACVILGGNADYISEFFDAKGFKTYAVAQDIDDAVKKARGFARKGDIVILNPGYASFDYFSDFAERGEAFRNAAKQD